MHQTGALIPRPRSAVPVPVYLHALALLLFVRAVLWLLPSRLGLALITTCVVALLRDRDEAPTTIGIQATAIRRASRVVPRASCLTQALAGQLLLASHGRRSRLRIGVRRGALGSLLAHAWIEIDDAPVLGDIGLERFVRLPELRGGLCR